jgi:hypothetical protein
MVIYIFLTKNALIFEQSPTDKKKKKMLYV